MHWLHNSDTGLESKSSREYHGEVPSVIEQQTDVTQTERNVTTLAQLDPDEMTTLAQAAVELPSNSDLSQNGYAG